LGGAPRVLEGGVQAFVSVSSHASRVGSGKRAWRPPCAMQTEEL